MEWDPPCGQLTAPTGEAGASHWAPTEGTIFGDGKKRWIDGDGILRAVSQGRPQEKLGPAIGRPQRGQYLGMGTSVRPANGANRRSWGQPTGTHSGMIESEGGYLREASRQATTGEGAASRQVPTD